MNNDKKKDLPNGMQKLNDDDTAQVSGGWTEVEDASSFFKPNRVSVTCDKCGATRKMKIGSKNMSKWERTPYSSLSGYIQDANAYYQEASFNWTCPNCGAKNRSEVDRFGGMLYSKPWSGVTETID